MVLGHRNASQRKKIKEAYQQLYNKSLIDDLHSELSGDFRVLITTITYQYNIHKWGLETRVYPDLSKKKDFSENGLQEKQE